MMFYLHFFTFAIPCCVRLEAMEPPSAPARDVVRERGSAKVITVTAPSASERRDAAGAGSSCTRTSLSATNRRWPQATHVIIMCSGVQWKRDKEAYVK